MTIFALIVVGLSVVALTLLVMVSPRRDQNRISAVLVIVVVLFLVNCYWVGQGTR